MDPVIIGDVAGDNGVDAGNVSALDAFTALLQPPQIPMPPTQLQVTDPNYVDPNSIHSPNAADPTLSLVGQDSAPDRAGQERSPDLQTVSVMLDHPHPDGSTGLTSATLALTYDPAVVSVSSKDITLGSIPSLGEGWQISSVVDQTTGQIGIQIYSQTPITANDAGSLVNIVFHILPGATVPATPVQLVDSVAPNGQWFGAGVADSQGAMILSPGMDRVLLLTGSDIVSSMSSNSSTVR